MWKDISTAPRDQPVFVCGNNNWIPTDGQHYCWAIFITAENRWREATAQNDSTLTNLTQWWDDKAIGA